MELFAEYFKKDHFLLKLDARVKILLSLAILVMVLSYKGFTLPLLITSLCFLLSMWMRIPLKFFLLRFSEPVFIAGMIILLKLFFSGKELLFTVDILNINISGYRDGFIDGLMIAGRIIAATSIVTLMVFSMPFTEFIAGLSWFKVPKGFIEILMFAYRYIFVLFEDAMVIYNAQKNRLGYSSIRRGLSSFAILAGSLMLRAFEHSHNITVSMIQRGYEGNIPVLKQRPFKLSEIIGSALVITAVGIVWKI